MQRLDCVETLGDITNRLEENEGKSFLHSSHFVSASDKITIYAIYIDNEGLPTVKYTLVLNDELKFKAFHENKFVSSTRYENIMKSKRLSCFTEIIRFIDFLQNLPSRNTVGFDEAKYHIEQLEIVEYPSELIRSKMTFLIEQTELALMHNMHRRYSPDFALDLCNMGKHLM